MHVQCGCRCCRSCTKDADAAHWCILPLSIVMDPAIQYCRGSNIIEALSKQLEDLNPNTCTLEYAACLTFGWVTPLNLKKGVPFLGQRNLGTNDLIALFLSMASMV